MTKGVNTKPLATNWEMTYHLIRKPRQVHSSAHDAHKALRQKTHFIPGQTYTLITGQGVKQTHQ